MSVITDNNTNSEESEPAHPFSGPQASWAAHEATKANESLLQSFSSTLSLDLNRTFKSPASLSTELTPYLIRMLSPNVSPVVVSGSGNEKGTASVRKASEQLLVQRAANAMGASGVRFERTRVNSDDVGGSGKQQSWQTAQWIYRMEPSLDTLTAFETGGKAFAEAGLGGAVKQRYAVRQVLEQEWKKEESRRAEAARMARFKGGVSEADAASPALEVAGAEVEALKAKVVIKRDFFGRPIAIPAPGTGQQPQKGKRKDEQKGEEGRVWITYHEGFSNAVRKPITMAELMRGL